ncbi:PLP-dependent aminotransferase family protein [Vibrio sp. S4M6]|uniref:MocR-like pyridoxine biosynthesis transcription factor PdxR n=1 Tax=Vibrio sinus TaxID=2946865 RepID=UPI00202A052C|nr:PLP-dependent aminotransferase family protein [Vibrio sinus]MCL9782452.1 PLP-dependent aminotransferase family protein [Vibrio sinus]
MALIDIGDLALPTTKGAKQTLLFQVIRDKIVNQLWPKGDKLPSTRKLADELSLSRNTVTSAYEQLVAEGYIESRKGSGFYVCIELPDHYFSGSTSHSVPPNKAKDLDINAPFSSGIPDLAQFPLKTWQRMLQRHSSRLSILGNQDLQGCLELRVALADYLATSRSVHCHSGRIIITSGAQQALAIALMATLQPSDSILMEQPGYTQMSKIIELLGIQYIAANVTPYNGLDLDSITQSAAKALYITPSNQYPLGTTLDTNQRLALINWAKQSNRWIIEDDYDSEFQFAHRPYTSLQGLAGQMGRDDCVIYIGSFSKVMFNSLRLGYMVVPDALVTQCLMIKDAISGDSPSHVQSALADFIVEGHLVRHIRKMRKLYELKHQTITQAISLHFADSVEIISQAAGLHVTIKWQVGINEKTFTEQAKQAGINIRPLSYYESLGFSHRSWQGAIIGYGNTALEDIAPKIALLAQLFTGDNI